MERALKWYNAPPTLGNQFNDTEQNFVQLPDTVRPQESIFAPDETIIDLYEYSLGLENNDLDQIDGLSCEASWISIEGHAVDGNESKPNDFSQNHLSQPLLQYYTALVNVILSEGNHEIRKTLLEDVRSNSKIGPLVPLLVSFIGTGMQRNQDNQVLVMRLLTLIEALFVNPHLNLSPKPYVSNFFH